jgi:hypothetical protein
MKKKISKILGVGLSVGLLASLLLTAAPVLADVSQPTVDVSADAINDIATYTLQFRINDALVDGDTITVTFPEDTDVAGAAVAGTGVSFTSGIGYGANTTAITTEVIDTDNLTVEISLDTINGGGIGAMAYVQVVITGVENPTEPGTYTLQVETSEEDDAVTSESYDIEAPTVGGFLYVYNPSNILLAVYGGDNALNDADADGHFGQDDYTISVGPGTYVLSADIDVLGEDLTVQSSGDTEDTIIDCDGFSIYSTGTGEGFTLDGFTIDDGSTGVGIYANDGTVKNCIITDDDTVGIDIGPGVEDATVEDVVIEDCADGIWVRGIDATIKGCDISEADGAAGIVLNGADGTSIEDCDIHDNDTDGIAFLTAGSTDTEISGCMIDTNDGIGIWVNVTPTELAIFENTIIDNEDEGLHLDAWDVLTCYAMFNNIYGNDDDAVTGVADVNALFNWWGTANEDDFEIGDDIIYEPWLMGEWATVVTGHKVEVDSDNLSGRDSSGVSISGLDDDLGEDADLISTFAYAANPEGSIDDPIAFYDILIEMDAAADLGDVNARIKLYDDAITEDSMAYFWIGDFWARCSDQEARDGVIYVTLTEDTIPTFEDLCATPFAVVAGEATGIASPALHSPTMGDDEVSLSPTFAWELIDDADGYYFELADNSALALPIVRMDGDEGRLTSTVYGYIGKLEYSTAYYWRVKAVSGTEAADDLKESSWNTGVFVTMAEPEEPAPPIVIEESEPPVITIEQPDIVVPLPAETQITPAWIYVIIGVGAVLVIAVVVLIVRTRRVA